MGIHTIKEAIWSIYLQRDTLILTMKLLYSLLLTLCVYSADGQTAQEHYDVAMSQLEQGATVKEIVNSLNACLTADSTFEDAYFLKAFLYYRLEGFEAAIDEYNRLLKINPFNEEALKRRALTKLQLHDVEGAIQDHDLRLVLRPLNPVAYFDRAYCRGLQDDVIGSIQDYSSAIKLNPGYKDAYLNRGTAKLHVIATNKSNVELFSEADACRDLNMARALGDTVSVRLIDQHCQ